MALTFTNQMLLVMLGSGSTRISLNNGEDNSNVNQSSTCLLSPFSKEDKRQFERATLATFYPHANEIVCKCIPVCCSVTELQSKLIKDVHETLPHHSPFYSNVSMYKLCAINLHLNINHHNAPENICKPSCPTLKTACVVCVIHFTAYNLFISSLTLSN